MKNLVYIFIFIVINLQSIYYGFSQSWKTINGYSILYSNPIQTTKVGIGIKNPLAKLHINAKQGKDALRIQINQQTRLLLYKNGGLSVGNYQSPPNRGLYVYGNIGVGTFQPEEKLHVIGNIKASNGITVSKITVNNHFNDDWGYAFFLKVNRNLTKAFTVKDKYDKEVFNIYGNGVVNAKKIYSESIQIIPNAIGISWYDHVFHENYKLITLKELEYYIRENTHLPDIPSSEEINKNGYDLTKMDGLLLKKIEELTIYIIKQQKEIELLKDRLNEK